MKEIKRYSVHAYGVDEDKNGDYCKYSQVKKLQARIKELIIALQLSKDMFIANDLILPHTFEVLDSALNGEGYKTINEIKAQGISEARREIANISISQIAGEQYDGFHCALRYLDRFIKKLRTKHD